MGFWGLNFCGGIDAVCVSVDAGLVSAAVMLALGDSSGISLFFPFFLCTFALLSENLLSGFHPGLRVSEICWGFFLYWSLMIRMIHWSINFDGLLILFFSTSLRVGILIGVRLSIIESLQISRKQDPHREVVVVLY